MKKRIMAIVIAGTMLFSATPVFGADDLLEFNVTPIAEEDLVVEEPEEAILEEVVSEEAAAMRYVSEETDTNLIEALEFPSEVFSSVEEIVAEGASSFTYYSQYAYQVKSDYDIITVYVKDTEGKYQSRLFFVYDRLYKEWLRYDYSEMAAETFLSNWEEKDSNGTTLYVPVEKVSNGKKVWHTNNSETAIDESKIPVLAAADVDSINYAWKALSEIPFAKNGSAYEYAGEGKEEEDPDPDPQPIPQPIEGDRTASATINGRSYTVIWSGAIQYNGRSHLWNMKKVSSKNKGKQTADLKVEILRDGALVDTSNYTVTTKNNKNVTKYKKGYQPYFTITLKGTYKKDNVGISKAKFPFDIVPCPVEQGKFQAKKVVVEGSKTTFTNLYFVFPDGKKVKLEKYSSKKKTGAYTAKGVEEGIQITGYNNLTGSGLLSMENPRKLTYEW